MLGQSLSTGARSRVGLHTQAYTLSVRIPQQLATILEEDRLRISNELNLELSASQIVRHAIETHLAARGHAVSLTPWPSQTDANAQIRKLEDEIRRLKKRQPHQSS